jgi:hypothetical protein
MFIRKIGFVICKIFLAHETRGKHEMEQAGYIMTLFCQLFGSFRVFSGAFVQIS